MEKKLEFYGGEWVSLSPIIIFIGLIAVGLPDTFQNVVLGFFLLVVMILFENSGRIEELKEKRAARQKAMSAS